MLKNKKLVYALLLISFLGFLDATYLTMSHFNGASVPCAVTGGCDQVLSSQYSEIFGIPVALGGALYYLLVFLLSIFHYDTANKKILTLIARLTPLGFVASLYFVYLQIFIIEAICQYCMLSAITSTLLFLLGLRILISKK